MRYITTKTHVSFFATCSLYLQCVFKIFQYAKLCNLTENDWLSAPVPDFLFELDYCDQMNARFEKMREGRDVFYAFHGSRLENFHSIIHNGLHCHLNKVSEVITAFFLFGFLLVQRHKSSWGCRDVLLFPSLWFMCAELCVWRGDLPHQWPQHGGPLQSPQQRMARESSGSAAQLHCHVWSHRSPGC